MLNYAYSVDGLHWTPLNGGWPVYNVSANMPTIRDPFVHRNPDGKTWRMVSTDGDAYGGTPNILTWHSDDLITWSPESVVEVMGPNFFPNTSTVVTNVWAPEWRWDPITQRYMVFWAARGNNLYSYPAGCTNNVTDQVFAFFRTWTTDFATFTQPEPFFFPACDIPGYGGIDGDLVQDENGRYVFVYKDARGPGNGHTAELVRGVRLVTSAGGIDGPYTNASISPLLAPTLVEAPELVYFKNQWFLYYDCSFFLVPPGYPRPPYGVSVSQRLDDYDFHFIEGACTGNSTQVSFPKDATHGSFVCISPDEMQALLDAFPVAG